MKRFAVPIACALVAGVAVVAALLSDSPPERSKPRTGVFFPESAGLRWASLEQPGVLKMTGDGTYWLAFRAFARGAPASLSLTGEDGTRFRVDIGIEPAIELVGPVSIHGGTTYWAAPGAGGGEVFTSGHRLVRHPLAALPGRGFWTPNLGEPLDATWLNTVGAVDVAGTDPRTRSFWLSFEVTSVDRQRTLTVASGAARHRVAVPERGARRRVTVGPFPLRGGRARVGFSSPGAVIRGGDPRGRTVRVGSLEALPRPRP